PLSNLDAKLREEMQIELRQIQRTVGTTTILVTHDQAEAMALSDRVVVMNAGRVEQAGTPDEVYRRPMTRFVADFIGRANFVDARVHAADAGMAEMALFGTSVRVPAAPDVRAGATATVVVRPESIRIGSGEYRGTVRHSTFLGPLVEYELAVGDHVLAAVDAEWMGHGLHEPGEEVSWSLHPEQAYALPPEEAGTPIPDDPDAAPPA
ncbi:MAG: ABC transporter ATP-binding protein, partial [Chloroflexi bacterium]|nr:ABC transporter ATP-binding protein [Chloroflexota bacterium]